MKCLAQISLIVVLLAVSLPAWAMKIYQGGYTGNGGPHRGIQFTDGSLTTNRIYIRIVNDQTTYSCQRFAGQAGNTSFYMCNFSASLADIIRASSDDYPAGTSQFVVDDNNTRTNWLNYKYEWLVIEDDGQNDVDMGEFLGTGADNYNVSCALGGDTPDLIILKNNYSSFTAQHSHDMGDATDTAKLCDGSAVLANVIQSVGANTFQLGNHNYGNRTGVTVYWVALVKGTTFQTASYTGDRSDGQAITLQAGFSADWVEVAGSGVSMPCVHSNNMGKAVDVTYPYTTTAAPADWIQSISADGITVGTNGNVNGGPTFYVWGFKVGTSGGAPAAAPPRRRGQVTIEQSWLDRLRDWLTPRAWAWRTE